MFLYAWKCHFNVNCSFQGYFYKMLIKLWRAVCWESQVYYFDKKRKSELFLLLKLNVAKNTQWNTTLKSKCLFWKNFGKKKNYVLVQRAWRTKFKFQPVPTRSNILSILKRFKETGSLNPRPRRKKTQAPGLEAAKSSINDLVRQMPNMSIREIARKTELSNSLVRRVLVNDLKLKPHKLPKNKQ